jgi:hypothetical protein
MSTSAVVMMVIGMVILWGGFAASVANAYAKGKKAN